ncbi:MAG: ECF transporter S component [Ignavibacteriales bacterium]
MSGTRLVTLYGAFTALITLATTFLKIPGPTGYYHLGDVVIYSAAAIMGGPFAAAAAAVGSSLADIWAGYAHWAPWTFFIKGLAAFIAGAVPRRYGKKARIPAMIIGAAVITLGYGVATAVMVDAHAAMAEVAGNLLQSAVGVAGAAAVAPAVEKAIGSAPRR